MFDWLGENAIDLVGLLSTVALLAVTAWYAKTTKDMANIAGSAASDSARATAAAERAAEAALDAARVAQSQIKPSFAARALIVGDGTSDSHTACLMVTSEGDAVVVEEVRIRRAFRELYETDPENPLAVVRDIVLLPFNDESELPKRLHLDEYVLMKHAVLADQSTDGVFARFVLDIRYTFSESGGAGATRRLMFDVDADTQRSIGRG